MVLDVYRKYPKKVKRRVKGVGALAHRSLNRSLNRKWSAIKDTLDLFRTDWEIDFELDARDLQTDEHE